tara:strand:- start:1518 stop:1736 length:219 start_codon:yes stop_codon:yes gene_type:complete
MSKPEKEKAHYNLYDNLENATEVASKHLNIVHIIATGLDYYLTQAYKSAPSLERAEYLINESVRRAKEENNG